MSENSPKKNFFNDDLNLKVCEGAKVLGGGGGGGGGGGMLG